MTSKFLLLRLVRWLGFSEVGISAGPETNR